MVTCLERVGFYLDEELGLLKGLWTDRHPSPFLRKVYEAEKLLLTLLILRRFVSLSQLLNKLFSKKEAWGYSFTELAVIAWLLILAVLLRWSLIGSGCFATIIMLYLLLGSINYPLCIIFIDRYSLKWKPQSFNRLIMLLFVNYLQIIVAFAYLYLNTATVVISKCGNAIARPLDALYFSLVTITTLGYGDMQPLDAWAKCLVILEVVVGLVFFGLVIATIINLSLQGRQK